MSQLESDDLMKEIENDIYHFVELGITEEILDLGKKKLIKKVK